VLIDIRIRNVKSHERVLNSLNSTGFICWFARRRQAVAPRPIAFEGKQNGLALDADPEVTLAEIAARLAEIRAARARRKRSPAASSGRDGLPLCAALQSWLRRERLSPVGRRWPRLARNVTRACRSVPVIANIARMASQLIRALDYKSLLVLGRGDAARHVDCPCLSEKAPAGNFKRGPHTPTPPAISARRARRAFPLPSSSSAQRLLHATTFPDAETSTHASHAHGDCSRCIGQ
jgi:hypothetical protein